MKNVRTLISALLVGMAYLVLLTPARADDMQLTVDGEKREALVFAPSKKGSSGKSPVILAFHGRGGNMVESSQGMRFESAWPEAIVVYMQGAPLEGVPEGHFWRYPGEPNSNHDLDYVDAVLAALRSKFPVDDRRLYATGFSNGAGFSYALWAMRPDTFAAFGIVAGRIAPGVHLTAAKPVVVIGGQSDGTIRFPIQLEAMKTAREVNLTGESGNSCGHQCTLYSSNKGAPVVTYIHDGGHIFPEDANVNIVNFFKQHALPH